MNIHDIIEFAIWTHLSQQTRRCQGFCLPPL